MPQWNNAPQGSDEWLRARVGKLTASRVADALATTKKGESEKRRKLKLDILAERLSGRMTDIYVNDAMKHGIKYEPEARLLFEDMTGEIVESCGIAFHDSIAHFGASPDGLIQDDAILEIKCPTTATFLTYKLEGGVPECYRPQMLAQMSCTGRKRGVFVAYDPRLPAGINLHIAELVPDSSEIEQVEEGAILFLSEVEELHTKLLEGL